MAVKKCKSIVKFCQDNGIFNPEGIEKVKRRLFYLRCKHDFCFWAYSLVRIKNKLGGKMIPFYLHYEQVCLLLEMEDMRLKNKPIRIILLKARQWGGSTLVQIYMAWLQLMWKDGWYSTIVAQTLATSRKIKAMYSKFLQDYPAWMLGVDEESRVEFSPYEGSVNDFIITYGNGTSKKVARDTVITIGTYENPDNTRGGDTALIHYSEVAIWTETKGKKPEDVIRSVSGGLMELPLTMEVLESTANGTGNFFHTEWERAKRGESNRRPVFIPFFKIEHDSIKVDDRKAFAQWLLDNKDNEACPDGWLDSGKYYWYLWTAGADFDHINWYRIKRKSFNSHADMASEAPANDIEAFKHSGARVFDIFQIEALRKNELKPKFIGELAGDNDKGKNALSNIRFNDSGQGMLSIWKMPENTVNVKNRYLVCVDIGGRSAGADYSVITVFDRMGMMFPGGKPEVVAEWYGHTYHDTLAWKAAQIATFYNKALLVIESNTLESKDKDRDTDGEHSEFILDQISRHYSNLYTRTPDEDEVNQNKKPTRYGFHTNTKTKPKIIDNLVACVHDAAWIERRREAIDELAFYEKRQNGSYGAIAGKHDDMLMTRAIGLWICFREMDMPKIIEPGSISVKKPYTERNESTFF
jgi:hypothetical protein